MTDENIIIPEEFKDISPIPDSEFKEKMASLVKEPGFKHAVRYVMPDVNYDEFISHLLTISTKEDFQIKVMMPFLEMLQRKTSDGLSAGGIDNLSRNSAYTFISNHRDIVLDASFLNLALLRENFSSTEVAIGNNLLIFDWIETLVKLNKSFIVKRDVTMRQALEAAIQLSSYIHFTIAKKNQSLWIAQREGRAKDSNDKTQESLLKMLGLSGGGDLVSNLLDINLLPVSISYEYDPNDYLKATEFLLKKKNPSFKKSQRDDLFSMETGLLQNKGIIHFEFAPCINSELLKVNRSEEKTELVKTICNIIDKSIHSHYKIFPCNYIAYDHINHTKRFADEYSNADSKHFESYLQHQLSKVEIPNLSQEDKDYIMTMMLTMYANPLVNKLAAKQAK